MTAAWTTDPVLPRFTVSRVFTDWGIDPMPFVLAVWVAGAVPRRGGGAEAAR